MARMASTVSFMPLHTRAPPSPVYRNLASHDAEPAADGGKLAFKRNLVPQSNEPISVEHLLAGTYRAAFEVGGQKLISDVFLVLR